MGHARRIRLWPRGMTRDSESPLPQQRPAKRKLRGPQGPSLQTASKRTEKLERAELQAHDGAAGALMSLLEKGIPEAALALDRLSSDSIGALSEPIMEPMLCTPSYRARD